MNIIDIILKKKNNQPLTKEEINYFITNLDILPDYQISALLMAIVLNGMNDEETINLTMAMANSGEVITYPFETVDKHSTGGVGDKVTLIVAPIVASLNCKVAKMSGRGLGHTGGTIDKLEAIQNLNTNISEEKFIKQVEDVNIAIMSQSKEIAPADKKLYAIRDVTGTVESIPLIAASIMSKKIAAGSKNVVLDIKIGKGAFMKNIEDAKVLAKLMVKIGNMCGIKTTAVLTNMDIPLGKNIGNYLEIEEAIEILKGTENNLYGVCVEIASRMVSLYKDINYEVAKEQVREAITSGRALNKFYEFIKVQGGNITEKAASKYNQNIYATSEGYINYDALELGKLSVLLGAGRRKKEDKLDYKAGIVLHKSINEPVKKGDLIATLYSDSKIEIEQISNCISEKEVNYKLIYEVI